MVSIHDATECHVDSRWHRAGVHDQLCDRLVCWHGDSDREGLAHTRPQTDGELLGLEEQGLGICLSGAAEEEQYLRGHCDLDQMVTDVI